MKQLERRQYMGTWHEKHETWTGLIMGYPLAWSIDKFIIFHSEGYIYAVKRQEIPPSTYSIRRRKRWQAIKVGCARPTLMMSTILLPTVRECLQDIFFSLWKNWKRIAKIKNKTTTNEVDYIETKWMLMELKS